MSKIEELKTQVQSLIDSATDKDMVESLSRLGASIDEAEAEHASLEKENKELLNSYKEMVKHTSIRLEAGESEPQRGSTEPLSFDSFLRNYKKEN